MQVVILTKERTIFSGSGCIEVTIPAVDGECTVCPNHIAYGTILTRGTIKVLFSNHPTGKQKIVDIEDGICSVKNNKVSLLVTLSPNGTIKV